MIIDLGLIDYQDAYVMQKELVEKRLAGEIKDTFLIAEHPAVFTIGRSAKNNNFLVSVEYLAERGIKVIEVDRGGDITFHGPGQIVVYPILDLKPDRQDLHKHMRFLEGLAIELLAGYGIIAVRVAGRTGVWIGDKKIASVGIASRNWVTFHGVSININTDLGYFSMINPCGLKGVEMISLDRILGASADMVDAKDRVKRIINARPADKLSAVA